MTQNGVEITPQEIINQITIDANNGVMWNPDLYLKMINGMMRDEVEEWKAANLVLTTALNDLIL